MTAAIVAAPWLGVGMCALAGFGVFRHLRRPRGRYRT